MPRDDVPHQELAGDVERVELGVELRGRELHLRERLPGERERRRERHVVAERDLGHLLQHRPELDVLERRAAVLGHQRADLLAERVDVQVAPIDRAGQHQRDVGEEPDVLLPERHQQQHHLLAHLGADLADHAEVQEVQELFLRLPHQVAGMRVGVEEAVDHDLLVEGLEQLSRGLLARRSFGRARDRTARDVAHHEQSRRGEVAVHLRAREGAGTARSPPSSAACCPPPGGSRARDAATRRGSGTPPPCRSPASARGGDPPSRRRPRAAPGPVRSAPSRRGAAP